MNRNFGLDLLRSIAIGLVLLSHGRFLIEDSIVLLEEFFIFGYLGVEIFFVLSGFLIGGILINVISVAVKKEDVLNFWKRRWFRTLPNYYLFLLVEFALALAMKDPGLYKFWLFPAFLQTFFFPARPLPFSVSWSLAVEEWYYILIPILLFLSVLFVKRQKVSFSMVVGLVIFGSLLLRVMYVVNWNSVWGPDIRTATVLRFDSIVFGLLGSLVFNWCPSIWNGRKRLLFFVGLASLIVNLYYLQTTDKDASFYCRTLQFTVVPASILLCMLLIHAIRVQDSFFKLAIESLSLWSYSLYLSHMIVLRGLEKVKAVVAGAIKRILNVDFGVVVDMGAFFLFFIVSLALSAAVFRYFEMPVTRLRDRFTYRERHSV